MTSTAGRYRSSLSNPEKLSSEKHCTVRSSISITSPKMGVKSRPGTAGKAVSVRDTFRLYRSEKDASGMLIMHPKDPCYDPERLYEDSLRLKADLHRLLDENKQLKTRLARLEKDCLPPIENSAADRLETVVRDQQTDLRKKDEEIVTLKREIQFYKIPDFMERLRQTQMDKDAMRKILDNERKNSGDVRGQIADLQEKLSVKCKENDRMRDEIMTLTDHLSEANQRKAAIEEELNTRKDLKKIPILKNEIVKLRGKIEVLEKENEQLASILKQRTNDFERLQQDLAESRTSAQKKESELALLQSAKIAYESDIAKLKSMLADERNSAETFSKSSQTFEKEIELLRRQLKNLTSTLTTRESEIEKLRSSLDSEHQSLSKQLQNLQDEYSKEKSALVTQNGMLSSTVTDMRKQSEEKAEQIIRGREREKELKEEIEKFGEKMVLRDGEIEALKGQIEDLMRSIEEKKAEFGQERDDYEQKIGELLERIEKSVGILFKKIKKKLKKREQDLAILANCISESGKESITPVEFKKILKSLKIVIDKLALRVVFRLLGNDECEMTLDGLIEKLRKKKEKKAENQSADPPILPENEPQNPEQPSIET